MSLAHSLGILAMLAVCLIATVDSSFFTPSATRSYYSDFGFHNLRRKPPFYYRRILRYVCVFSIPLLLDAVFRLRFGTLLQLITQISQCL